MLEDTLKSVKEAEAKAEETLREAESKAASVLEEAKAKAQAMKEETQQKVKLEAQELQTQVQELGSRQMEEAAKDAQREIEALKELIAPRKKEAVEAVIASLV